MAFQKNSLRRSILQDIDWNEVDNFQIDSDIEKKLGIAPPEEIGFGGGFAIGGAQGVPGAVPPHKGHINMNKSIRKFVRKIVSVRASDNLTPGIS